MGKKILSLCMALVLCLGLLPVTALAAEGAPSQLYVGNQQVIRGTETTYWSTNNSGELELVDGASDTSKNWNVKYDPTSATLTLSGATIQGGSTTESAPFGSGIYALSSSNQPVALTIELIGTNTITGNYGICVDAQQGGTVGTNASLLIQNNSGDDGSLEVSGSSYGIYVKSGTGDASLTIKNASVDAKTTQIYFSYAGVCVQSGASATGSPQLSLAVNGGSLTASASEGNDGIQFYVGNSSASATTSLTVSENAIVDAKTGGIRATDPNTSDISDQIKVSSSGDGNNGGIVWNSKDGTVYGEVELQDELTIGSGETLTIGKDASLTVSEGTTLTNNGTINVESGGKLEGTPTGEGTVVSAPKITTESLPDGTVGTAYNQPLEATGSEAITWSLASGTLPTGLNLNGNTISGTPTTAVSSTFTVRAENSAGSATQEYTLKINSAPTVSVTGVTLNPTSLSLFTGDTAILTATVEPSNATNKNVTWSSDKPEAATVEGGKVTAVGAGEATITVTTEDGSHTATCKVTVTQSTYSISADTTPLDFGSVYTSYTQPAAQTVTITNNGNQPLTLTQPASTSSFVVGTLSTTSLPVNGTATFTVQPKAGLAEGTYSENITISDSGHVTLPILATFTVRQYSGGSSDPTYSITLPSRVTGGELKLSRRYAEKGETVTLTAIPDEGYELDTLTVTDSKGKEIELTHKGGNEYTFKMPAGRVEIEVSFREIEIELPFTDVPEGAWYEDAAAYVYNHGLMAGTSATTFAPDATTSRSMIATILWRMAGSPVVNYAMDYTDVAQGQWYSEAIRWAASEGIVGGYGNGLFGTNDPITREQFAAMLYRFAQTMGYDVSIGENTNILSYTDVADLSEYAISAMQWAVGAGIINGTGDGSTLSPQGQATRAQAAVMLMRFCEEYVTW